MYKSGLTKIILPFFIFLFVCSNLQAQNNCEIVVYDSIANTLIEGVNVSSANSTSIAGYTNSAGYIELKNLHTGIITLQFSYVGYKTVTFSLNLSDACIHYIAMQPDEKALQSVTVVSSTRSNDRIENATTKVEVLGIEDMNEESTLKPGNIASIIGDMSGIQIQQSSAASGNSNVRIQGLDGKYTQILRDGMPLYEGYSGGFGILSIPPLDLKQIELIKGAASTLYGGGAIAGLINLISKKPGYEPDVSLLINQTTLKETNFNAWYAQRWKQAGFTLFAGENLQQAVDVNDDGFSDVPDSKATIIHPSLFIYPSSKSYISLSWSGSFENRTGGDMMAVKNKGDSSHPYFETNKTNRNTFIAIAENHFSKSITGTVKTSYSRFVRDEITNTYFFNGSQDNFYSEASVVAHTGKHTIAGGINITADKFSPSDKTPADIGDISNTTLGIFAQDSWQVFHSTKLETGLRADHHTTYGNFLLPRIAFFQHIDEHWGARLGFGMGYKTPNPLAPQIQDFSIYQMQPISTGTKAETSYGGNAEINYKKDFGDEKTFFINHAFFITSIRNPVVAAEDITGKVSFSNQGKPVTTMGFDTYIQATINNWELYLGYTYTDAERKYLPADQFMILTPRNRAASVIAYTIDGKWRFGLEGSYTGEQRREDYTKTPAYLFMAAMIEKDFGPCWSLVLNCENLLDERQSKYEPLYTGSIQNPVFNALWAPIDGRVINLCLRLKPFEKEN